MNARRLLRDGTELVAVLLAAFHGFLFNLAPTEEIRKSSSIGITSFILLIVLLFIIFFRRRRQQLQSYRKWMLIAAIACALLGPVLFFVYLKETNRLTFVYPPDDPHAQSYVRGKVLTPKAKKWKDDHPGISDSWLVDNFGGIDDKEKVWTHESIGAAEIELTVSYVLFVVLLAGAVLCLLEGLLFTDHPQEMNLKGGVIIIGSLLWDDDQREIWRTESLKLETKIATPLRIRYGRDSPTRRHTFTMVFSNHPTTGLGNGYVVSLKRNIENREMLKHEAVALAKAEGLWTEASQVLSREWGAVGLLVNENRSNAVKISSKWKGLFHEHRSDQPQNRFDYSQFCIIGEVPIIDADGLLKIDWPPDTDSFDFLLATPTVPNPRKPLTPKAIAKKMIEANYSEYFDNNIAHNIRTFQDEEIMADLNDLKKAQN